MIGENFEYIVKRLLQLYDWSVRQSSTFSKTVYGFQILSDIV